MAEDLLQKGLAMLKQATAYDAAGDVQKAISSYLLALEVLVKCHGYEKLDKNRALLKEKIQMYMDRVEVLKRGGAPPPPPPSSLSSSVSAPTLLPSVPAHVPSPSAPPDDLPSPPRDPILPSVPSLSRLSPRLRSPQLEEQTVLLKQDMAGVSYDSLFGEYLKGAVRVTIEDPYLKTPHQLRNLVRLIELIVHTNDAYEILVVTKPEGDEQMAAFDELKRSLREHGGGITLSWRFSDTLHDRALRLSNGWKIVLGRGLDIWQKPPPNFSKYYIGANDMALRKCLECEIHFLREKI